MLRPTLPNPVPLPIAGGGPKTEVLKYAFSRSCVRPVNTASEALLPGANCAHELALKIVPAVLSDMLNGRPV